MAISHSLGVLPQSKNDLTLPNSEAFLEWGVLEWSENSYDSQIFISNDVPVMCQWDHIHK